MQNDTNHLYLSWEAACDWLADAGARLVLVADAAVTAGADGVLGVDTASAADLKAGAQRARLAGKMAERWSVSRTLGLRWKF